MAPLRRRRSGALPGPLRAPMAWITGFEQVVVAPDAVRSVLDRPDLLVPYDERARLLGLDAFPLATNGPDHAPARRLIASVLASSVGAHRVAVHDAVAVADACVHGAGRRLDVVSGLIVPTLERWVDRWFGLAGEGPALLRTSQMVTHAMFFNPTMPKGSLDALALDRTTRWVEQHRLHLTSAVGAARPGTLVAHLLAATGGDPDLTARHLLGLTVGPLALGATAIARATDHLLGQRATFDRIAGADHPPTAARRPFLDALRVRPPLDGVIRTNPDATGSTGSTGSDRAPDDDLPPGPILVATALAMRCPHHGSAIEDHLAFGHGAHRCLGVTESTDIASVILASLATRAPVRSPDHRGALRPAPAPSGVATWPFPGSLEVVLDPPAPRRRPATGPRPSMGRRWRGGA